VLVECVCDFANSYSIHPLTTTVKGFRRRMLAVRPVEGVPSAKLFRLHLFWMFTLVGLTVPYRIWFSRHCDELRVTVAKETATGKSGSSSWSWFSKNDSKQSTEWNMEFKSRMRELALYARGDRLALTEAKSETKAELPSPTEEDVTAKQVDVVSILHNETFTEMLSLEANATETIVEDSQETKEQESEPPPPPPPPTKEEETTATSGEATDEPVSTETSNYDDKQ